MSGRRLRRIQGVAVVAAVTVLAGASLTSCSTIAKLTTKEAVSRAFTDVQRQSGVTIRISLGLTAAQLTQLASAHGGSGMPSGVARGITESALVFSFQTGNGEALNSKQTRKDRSD